MDMKKHFLPLLLCCTLLTGCAAAGADTKQVREIPGDVDIPQLVSAETAEGGYAAFAAELLRQTRSEGENTLVSPLSVALALGMTANGAAGDTLAEFQDLFGMDLDITALVNGTAELTYCLTFCAWMAGFWVLRYVLHSVFTSLSHHATFHVLANSQ